ncbi:cobalt-precorrin 5A hydrolase [Pelotomaculum terephthalicicum JT]|uniref:cobalt-precorrin 5A hydrolase n=1 Tax=Pelotomaculum TaxID=191373 RepID=UPI0009D3AF56|nr:MULTISPECIES: cobalt-precorrin 5A hydrolase [Pelotomaculum]MCG9967326.1 cobalt-precorrin 5A hydrolase [Pelotomaculum terephthalicicum JT]OPX90678.1 MAG: cobalamin biosynthesis protein CbiG [Pelotomaculum sp. PtaB.Bin117]OPY61302.1 MAG: cobalamin biosynthesis protein CbiG [Pelotomaculum sp. PtaU1.Bin065]
MNVAIVTLTEAGLETGLRLAKGLGGEVTFYAKQAVPDGIEAEPVEGRLRDFLGVLWGRYEGLILIMAAGIAVRCLANYLESKYKDPAVVVLDEQGRFAVSLLSGHLGGANELARRAAGVLGGEAVITTASDLHGLPALDLLARELGLKPSPPARLAAVSAAMVNGRRVGIWAEEPWLSRCRKVAPELPCFSLESFGGTSGWDAGVLVTSLRLPDPGPRWLFFRPAQIVAGIGCRRDIGEGRILAALRRALREAGYSRWSLAALASMDLKAGEPGLLAAARRLGCGLNTYPAEDLAAVLKMRPDLTFSSTVQEKVGVGGVCEPAALLAAGGGELIFRKHCYGGVTIALARAAWR